MRLLAVILMYVTASLALAEDVYQAPQDFLNEVFDGTPPAAQMLLLKDELRTTSTRIMGHRYPRIRLRYWLQDGRSAWILEEIGKERPITTGLVVGDDGIERIRVLVFRESRGWEVRHPFFTDQFPGTQLDADMQLDRDIDGISGATLSVRALKKLARLALYLHTQVTTDS